MQVPPDGTCCGEFGGSLSERHEPGSAALGSLLGVALGVRAGYSDRWEGVALEISDAESAELRPAQAGQAEELCDGCEVRRR